VELADPDKVSHGQSEGVVGVSQGAAENVFAVSELAVLEQVPVLEFEGLGEIVIERCEYRLSCQPLVDVSESVEVPVVVDPDRPGLVDAPGGRAGAALPSDRGR
jgi:hypothetical protein